MRPGGWQLNAGMPIHRIAGTVLGVVGFWHIGRAVVARALGLGMRVVVSDPSDSPGDVRPPGAKHVELDRLLADSDAVSPHVPVTPATRHLIDANRLGRMRPDAYLINCALGAVVDLDVLADALSDGRIGGAGLDVFDPERVPPAHPLDRASEHCPDTPTWRSIPRSRLRSSSGERRRT